MLKQSQVSVVLLYCAFAEDTFSRALANTHTDAVDTTPFNMYLLVTSVRLSRYRRQAGQHHLYLLVDTV